jgi:hypothetical protein
VEGFPTISRACPNCSKGFSFGFVEFSKIKLFNIQKLLKYMSQNYYTTLVHPYLLRAFQWHEACNMGVVVWDISM